MIFVSRRSFIFLNWSNSLRVWARESVRVMMAPFIENCLSQVREQSEASDNLFTREQTRVAKLYTQKWQT